MADGDIQSKPIRAVVDDMMQQSQQALESGARVTAGMNELRRRGDEFLDWRRHVQRHPWLPLGLAVGLSVLVYLAFARKR